MIKRDKKKEKEEAEQLEERKKRLYTDVDLDPRKRERRVDERYVRVAGNKRAGHRQRVSLGCGRFLTCFAQRRLEKDSVD